MNAFELQLAEEALRSKASLSLDVLNHYAENYTDLSEVAIKLLYLKILTTRQSLVKYEASKYLVYLLNTE